MEDVRWLMEDVERSKISVWRRRCEMEEGKWFMEDGIFVLIFDQN